MSNNLNNKVAYITGGSKGIGYGIAKILLENGMKVAISSRSLGAAQQAAASLSNDASKVLAIESDVSLMDAETKAIKTIIDHFGQLDVLVANAGVGHFASIDQLSAEEWKNTIDTNLTGVFNCTKVISPSMIQNNFGRIINTSSIVGLYGNYGQTNYAATKAGVIGLTKTWSRELGKKWSVIGRQN